MAGEELHIVVKRLILVRALRSVGQGAMVVDLTLYLKSLHWSGTEIGAVTTGAGLFGALLILLVGVISDRIGRRPFLLIYEGLTIVAAGMATVTTAGFVLVLAIVLAGFGRGQSGAAGPFMPAEQAWLAAHVKKPHRGRVFSLNNAVGFIGMAVGSIVAGLPAVVHRPTVLGDYRPIFLMVMALSFICSVLILMTKEDRRTKAELRTEGEHGAKAEGAAKQWHGTAQRGGPEQGLPVTADEGNAAAGITRKTPSSSDHELRMAGHAASSEVGEVPVAADVEKEMRHRENVAMMQLAAINTINGLAVGLTGPMMVYWFNLRFGASAAEIGATLAVGFLLTGLMSILSGWLSDKYGMVKSVTGMRVIGSSLMLLLPLIPSFWGASGLYALRSAMNRGTQGNRSALSASIVRDQRRGLSISLNALSMRLPSALGPTISGWLFDTGALNLPLFLTAGLQLLNAWLYQRMFGRYDKSGDDDARPGLS
ncbi:MFS transporter [Alicyclobacillus curvatus]|nr:MFS transporter [Alicyclobacillus curvatus]